MGDGALAHGEHRLARVAADMRCEGGIRQIQQFPVGDRFGIVDVEGRRPDPAFLQRTFQVRLDDDLAAPDRYYLSER